MTASVEHVKEEKTERQRQRQRDRDRDTERDRQTETDRDREKNEGSSIVVWQWAMSFKKLGVKCGDFNVGEVWQFDQLQAVTPLEITSSKLISVHRVSKPQAKELARSSSHNAQTAVKVKTVSNKDMYMSKLTFCLRLQTTEEVLSRPRRYSQTMFFVQIRLKWDSWSHDKHMLNWLLWWTITRVMETVYIFCRHSTREPALLGCDDEQGGLFYSAGPSSSSVLLYAHRDHEDY